MKYLKNILPKQAKRFIKLVIKTLILAKFQFNCYCNKYIFFNKLIRKKKLHIGCGSIHLNDFINVDSRATQATDLILDCSTLNVFPVKYFNFIYAHAFLEHLYLNQRQKFLKSAYERLLINGKILILGIPDFERIAKAYLQHKPGISGEWFTLMEVYRLTHGDPEQATGWWLEQLHKSLFDKQTVIMLLNNAGFKSYCIFTYSFREDKISVTLGFMAYRNSKNKKITKLNIAHNISELTNDINLSSISIIYNKT